MAAGAFAAGLVVDLTTPSGMWPAFLAAAVGFAVSAVLLHLASDASGDCAGTGLDAGSAAPGGWETYRHFVGNRQLRLLALVSMALAAGFYAQFETGLPAFALQALAVRPSVVGTAAAANCLVIVALQWLVVRLTGRHRGAALLIAVAAIWVMSWLFLEAALFVDSSTAGVLFVIAFMTFALGETMYAPILSPLAASVAPAGMVGTTLGTLSALRTGVSAAGPSSPECCWRFDVPARLRARPRRDQRAGRSLRVEAVASAT